MNYLKASEVSTYVTRVSVPSGTESRVSQIASRLIDAYVGRPIALATYRQSFELNASLVGRLPIRPVVTVVPNDLETGFRIRPLKKTIQGQRQLIGEWVDIEIPADITDLIDLRTGRIEVYRSIEPDYGRMQLGEYDLRPIHLAGFLADIEFKAGHLVDTTLTAAASSSAVSISVLDASCIHANETYLTIGDDTSLYLVTAVVGQTLTITPGLTQGYSVGETVSQKVPEEIKLATAMVIEDRLTYEPNTLRQLNTLDIITDRYVRADISPIPVDAQLMLGKYKN